MELVIFAGDTGESGGGGDNRSSGGVSIFPQLIHDLFPS